MSRKTGIIISSIFFMSVCSYSQGVVKLQTADVPDTVAPKEERIVVFKPEREVEKSNRKSYPMIRPTILFTAPTARVVSSLAIHSVGGGTISPEYEEQKRKFFMGVIGFGLGGISELQLSTLGVFDNLVHGSTNIPGTAFKIRLFKESKSFPEVSVMLRTSPGWVTTNTQIVRGGAYYDFMSKSATLYFLVSKALSPDFTLHLGIEGSDYRMKTEGEDESQDTFYGGTIGFEKNVNDKTALMGELRRVPELNFSVEGKGDVLPITLGIFGVRFFFCKVMSIDAGITYASDFEGIADAILHTNITTAFSLEELYGILFK